MAIPAHASLSWQAVISDIQALLLYAYDSTPMRQELRSYDSSRIAAARLKSRWKSVARIVRKIPFTQLGGKITIQDNSIFIATGSSFRRRTGSITCQLYSQCIRKYSFTDFLHADWYLRLGGTQPILCME